MGDEWDVRCVAPLPSPAMLGDPSGRPKQNIGSPSKSVKRATTACFLSLFVFPPPSTSPPQKSCGR